MWPIVPKVINKVLAVAIAALVAVGVTACGGSRHVPAGTVVEVGETPITKATLNHWMSTLLGGDFFEIAHITPPKGMVSDPPDDSTCIADMRVVAPTMGAGELTGRCEELEQAVKEQALNYLISVQRLIDEGAKAGLKATPGEIQKKFAEVKSRQFSTEADLREYLAERDWTLSDELYLVKRDVLSVKLSEELVSKFRGGLNSPALVSYVQGQTRKWTAKTACRTGYVVSVCKDYTSADAARVPSPAVLIEKIGAFHPKAAIKTAPDLNCSGVVSEATCKPVG
jgi:hypothetical protein